ncbi:uncharacterized protein TNCV_3011321 [Trichonephila clavipes]|nr:uncharacterized protein TNCV_3011321 [Trichonephila clavipes]
MGGEKIKNGSKVLLFQVTTSRLILSLFCWETRRVSNNLRFKLSQECLATLTTIPLGLGSNPGEDMNICKCIVPSRHGGTLNSRRAASPLVRLVKREERWEVPDHPQGVLPQNWDEIELNRSPVWCSKLRLTTGIT